MLLQANTLIKNDFASFVRKAFRHMHDGEKLGDHNYIDYLCHELQKVAAGEKRRLIINMPPRHLKTFLAAICLSAWVLGRNPGTRIMIVTYTDMLAAEIAYAIRALLQSAWYQNVFSTRLADDRTKVTDFATTQGGGVYAASIEGSITGRGADLLIFDDPVDIDNANNIEHLEKINARFDSKVMSRLNSAKQSRVVVIAHRLNERDLSGHLQTQGGWKCIALPMIAKRTKVYEVGHGYWRRKKASLLRPEAFGKKEIKRLKKTLAPDFETLYQQNPGGAGSLRLKREYFQTYESLPFRQSVVLSIDPAQRGGPNNSYSTIQAWSWIGGDYYLIDQWREQCTYSDLRTAFLYFVRTYRPVAALIEATAMGPQLLSEMKRHHGMTAVEVVPDGRSKTERLLAHFPTIQRKHIYLPQFSDWREAYINEFLEFPNGKFDDQVDATSQFLDWASTNPMLPESAKRNIGILVNSRGQHVKGTYGTPVSQCRGAVFVPRWRRQ